MTTPVHDILFSLVYYGHSAHHSEEADRVIRANLDEERAEKLIRRLRDQAEIESARQQAREIQGRLDATRDALTDLLDRVGMLTYPLSRETPSHEPKRGEP